MKYKIFKYLVKKHGFRVFAIDASAGESYYINKYIRGGNIGLENAMNKMIFWRWHTKEFRQFVKWMHDYNQKKPPDKQIYYIGLDCRYEKYQPDLIENYIRKVKPEFLPEINGVLSMIWELHNYKAKRLYHSYKAMSRKHKKAIADTLDYLYDKMTQFKQEMIAASSKYHFHFTRHLVKNLEQANDEIFSATHGLPRVRDKCMAENALWISKLLGKDVKVAVWGDNVHVSTRAIDNPRMGHYLKKELGNEYQVIGFEFSTGSVTAVNSLGDWGTYYFNNPPGEGSIVELFHAAKYKNFILNLNALPKSSELSTWLSSRQDFKEIGALFLTPYYKHISIGRLFNVMIYFDYTHHTNYYYFSSAKKNKRFNFPTLRLGNYK